MRKLEPEYLVPSHTEPVFGLEAVSKQLTDYRDGIQWVYVETIRGANEGKSMDELASSVGLPLHLRDNDALDELYGQIDWSVRAIYSGELGWFDGQAEVRFIYFTGRLGSVG
jgi:alkyl sulfatase BDS1-like metallo-beta-lactamase superfamily hydrolase